MRRIRTTSVAAAALVGAGFLVAGPAQPAQAYCKLGAGYTWSGHGITARGLASPSSFATPVKNSVLAWNGRANWTFGYVSGTTQGPYLVNFKYENFVSAGRDDSAPGETTFSLYNGHISSSVVHLNSTWSWNNTGTMSKSLRKVDVQAVSTHEVGHVLGLGHPYQCHTTFTAAEKAAVMYVDWTRKLTPNSDDVAGLRSIYGT